MTPENHDPVTVAEVLGTPPPPPAAPAPASEPARDALGRAFDPAKYAATEAGIPKKDSKGRFYSRFLGKRAGIAPEAPRGASGPAVEPAPDLSDIAAAARGTPPPAASVASGEVGENATVETVIGLLQILLVIVGEEEGVLTSGEKILLRPPLERLLTKYNVGADVLPAEVEILFAVAGIVIERVKRGGKTATAFAKFKAWLAAKFFAHRGAQIGREMRREVPNDLVAGLRAQVERLQSELAAKPSPAVPESSA